METKNSERKAQGCRVGKKTVHSRTVLAVLWVASCGFWVLLVLRLDGLSKPPKSIAPLQSDSIRKIDAETQGADECLDVSLQDQDTALVGQNADISARKETGDCINVNLAQAEKLESLPGIGPVLAQRIIEYRDAHGPFKQPRDLMGVKGIGEAKQQKLEPHICF